MRKKFRSDIRYERFLMSAYISIWVSIEKTIVGNVRAVKINFGGYDNGQFCKEVAKQTEKA